VGIATDELIFFGDFRQTPSPHPKKKLQKQLKNWMLSF